MGVKQGCLLSPSLFGLYVDGLEKHLLESAVTDAAPFGGSPSGIVTVCK